MLIKNKTPYIGKLKLKFEKYPEYSGRSILNNVHLNLGFTKLVSRMTPRQTLEGGPSNIDPNKIELIEKYTGGVIGCHKFGTDDEYVLENSFLTKDGVYIGNIKQAWWYYNQNMKVCNDYPHGVAEVYEGQTLIGYYGYTHRGGSMFKIGDRLFDESYVPKEDDYEEWEWEGYKQKFIETYKDSDELEKDWVFGDGVAYVMPFKRRGKKDITELSEAKEAAINMSKYLS
jgi:hypothetical protein